MKRHEQNRSHFLAGRPLCNQIIRMVKLRMRSVTLVVLVIFMLRVVIMANVSMAIATPHMHEHV